MLVAGLRAYYKDPQQKVRGILRHARDSRVPIGAFSALLVTTDRLNGAWDESGQGLRAS